MVNLAAAAVSDREVQVRTKGPAQIHRGCAYLSLRSRIQARRRIPSAIVVALLGLCRLLRVAMLLAGSVY